MSGYVGAILAGGRGSRMGALGEGYPKALLPLANEPLMTHHLRLFAGLGITHAFVLVGYRGEDLVKSLGSQACGVRLEYVEQGPYLGSAHALGRLRDRIRDPFLLVLGDYFCALSDPARLTRRLDQGQSAIAAKREPDMRKVAEACELRVDAEGRLLEIVEKPARPAGDLKGCGVYALQPDIFEAVARTPRTALRDEYELTHSLQLHVEAGKPIYGEDTVVWDRNFTRPEDILESNLEWLGRTRRDNLIAAEARIGEDVEIRRTVVGDRAHLANGSRLQDVVVFAGARVAAPGPVSQALVTPDGVYPIGQLTGKEGP